MTGEPLPADIAEGIRADMARVFGVAPEACRLTPLPGAASTRRYVRAYGADSLPAPVNAPSLIVMVLADPDPFKSAEEVESTDPAIRELPFVNVHRYLSAHGVAVPALYHYNVPDGRLYLEDCGDELFVDAVTTAPAEARRALYTHAVETLVAMQEAAHTEPDTRCLGFRRTFDESLLAWELDHFREYGVEAVRAEPLTEEETRALGEPSRRLAAELASAPREFAHRDYHSRNIMVHDGRLRLIDFQDALLATAAYDLASLLRDDYVTVLRDECDAMVEVFLAERARRNIPTPPEKEFRRLFLTQGLQRNLKVVGRFHYINLVKHKPEYLQYIPRVLGYIRSAFEELSAYDDLRRAVARYYPEVG